jgi:hypothetical protein
MRHAHALTWLAALICVYGMGLAHRAVAVEPAAIVVTSPRAGTTVHDNSGAVPVAVIVQGAAYTTDHRVRVLLDGKPYGTDQRSLQFTLQGVERGEHTLQIQLLDNKEAVRATSPAVTFYLWQASRLFPTRKDVQPPPK